MKITIGIVFYVKKISKMKLILENTKMPTMKIKNGIVMGVVFKQTGVQSS